MRFSKLWRSCLLLVLAILLGWQLSARAQSTSQLDARLSRLESANTLLQSRISRLESSLSGASTSRNITLPEAPSVSAPAASGSALAEDPVFKRLATLVIELRERIIALEAR